MKQKKQSKKIKIYHFKGSFECKVKKKELNAKVRDIYNHPDKYSDYKYGSDAAYYDFIKYLYIKWLTGREIRLADYFNHL